MIRSGSRCEPHDWSIELGYTQDQTTGSNGFLPGGVVGIQYRVTEGMGCKECLSASRVSTTTSGVDQWSRLGILPIRYLDFEYDLTPYLKAGENTIAVRVDRRAYADSRWYVGAGIYRPVHLIARNEIYIPTHGQFITTPEVSEQSAEVNVRTEFVNSFTDKAAKYQLCSDVR